MFEVGKLVARIALEGSQVFRDDLRRVGKEFDGLSDTGKASLSSLGTGMVALGASIVTLAGLAIARFASFDKAMSAVSATTGESVENMDKLREAAIEAGAASVYTAEEAAEGINELAKAGVKTADVLGGGLTGSLALAAAGQIGVAEAAEVASTAMTQFRLSGEEIPHLADLLANGANKAQGGVSDLSQALKQSGLVAAQMGLSVEDTIGTLSAFASAGLLGSDAGTSFRTMLLSLANPSKEAQAALKRYNIEAYDSQGAFVGVASLQQQLRKGFNGVKDSTRDAALATIFGSDAIRAANVLYAESKMTIGEWTDAVSESGAAARTAAELQNNLSGDIEKLGGAFDSALIQTGEGANGVLRDMVQLLTAAIDVYNALDPAVQQFGLVLGLGVGALLLFGGTLLLMIPKVVEFRLAVKTLNTELPQLRKSLGNVAGFLGGPWGIALAAATFILGGLIQQQVEGAEKAKAYADTLDATTQQITASTRSMTIANLAAKQSFGFLESDSGFDAAEKLGIDLDLVTDAALGNVDALKALRDEMGAGSLGSDEYKAKLKELGLNTTEYNQAVLAVDAAVKGESGSIEEAIRIAEQKASVDGVTTDSNGEVAASYGETSDQVEGLTLNLNDLIESLNKANGIALSAEEANIKYRDRLAEVADAAAKSNAGISLSTEKGRENRSMLLDLAKAGQDVAQANLDAGGTTEEYAATLEKSREAWIKQAIALGATKDEANALADSIYRIPTSVEIQASANTDPAIKKLNLLRDAVSRVQRRVDIGVDIASNPTGVPIRKANGGIVEYYANGGMRESHVAQIAAAGSTRVWNEPETGGEGYIPMSPAKRGEALPVLEEIATRFGYELTPKGKGSARASSSPSGGGGAYHLTGSLDIGGMVVDIADARIEEYDRDIATDQEGR